MSSVAHDSQRTALGGNGPVSESEYDRPCTGCNDSIGSDTGGVAVQFGNSLWHVDWYVLPFLLKAVSFPLSHVHPVTILSSSIARLWD